MSSKYIQVADIDLGISPWNLGEGWNPSGDITNKFEGEFIGNNLNIENLTINRGTTNYQALFGYTGSSSITKNVWLQNVNVVANDYVGGLSASSLGNIENCYVSGVISGNTRVGGLVGMNSPGEGPGAIVTASYYDMDLSQRSDNYGCGIPKTTFEMQQGIPSLDIYTGWDTNIWQFTPNDSYPVLKNIVN